MILVRLVVNDFGVFSGEHAVLLAPKNKRPIILFGGKNGSGKSTLLEALRLCLYGPGALGSVSREQYLNYLDKRIHSNPTALIQPSFASILVEFQYGHSEGIATYVVTRSWERRNSRQIREYLTIERNGKPLQDIEAEYWQDFIHELIPPGVSQLFFFDGEKIQQLAEDTLDQQTLADAIKSLLGLDIVERLEADLRIHFSRINKITQSKALLRDFRQLESKISSLNGRLKKLRHRRLQQEHDIEAIKATITRAEKNLASQGGAYARGRDQMIQQQATLKERIGQSEGALRELAGGLLPFALVPKLCRDLRDQLLLEEHSSQLMAGRALLASAKKELEKRLRDTLSREDLPQQGRSRVEAHFLEILNEPLSIEREEPVDCFHGVSGTTHRLLAAWINEALTSVPESVRGIALSLERTYRELEKLEASLHKVPAEDVLKPLLAELHELNEKLAKNIAEALLKDGVIKELEFQLEQTERQYTQLAKKLSAGARQAGRLQMLPRIEHALEDYRLALIEKKVSELQDGVTDCFNLLSRKKDSVRKITIDPKDFSITLYDRQNKPLPKSQLSAGEKQIYAISMLWALGKTSGRPLPIIIDTPLARLDSEHRKLLIDHYFALASHQLIMLSTDTEVDQHYFYELEGAIARVYQLEFDHNESSTSIKRGYFWKDNEAYKIAAN